MGSIPRARKALTSFLQIFGLCKINFGDDDDLRFVCEGIAVGGQF